MDFESAEPREFSPGGQTAEISIGAVQGKGEANPFIPKFEEFYNTHYKKQIEKLVREYPQKRSLEISFKDLENFDFQLADELIEHPDLILEGARLAAQHIDVPALEIEKFAPNIRILNLPQDRQPLVRDVSSKHLGKLFCVEGVIRQLTDVLPKLKQATWRCKRCGNTYVIEQVGHQQKLPGLCSCKHKDFELIPEESAFVDYQKIQIQEPLEMLKGSEQAVNLDIYIDDDFVNRVAPGDRTRIAGILRLYPPSKDKKNVYNRYLEANHIEETEKEFEDVNVSEEEQAKIKELAANPKIYELLVQSIAPNIYGHEVTKEAISLQLFGGVKKALPGGTNIRGNVHVLLVGDPGTAKSQLLMAADRIAPKSVYVAGKTSSGVGLTASAVKDDFGEGGWTLKAGALVLASGGMVMVDEFDKMEAEDRSAMHEAMEQGKISVAKAGLVTRFKTDTSVLAAANPKHSRFDTYKPFFEQVDLPASLISRFDLFFMIRDTLDKKKDEAIASHILQSHRAGQQLLQHARGRIIPAEELQAIEKKITPAIDTELLSKFISYARQNVFPILTAEAMQMIQDFYVNLRDSGRQTGSYAATHRQLEGLVRLAEASARIRLSDFVQQEDAERSIRLVRSSLEDVVKDPTTGKIDIDIVTTGTTSSTRDHMRQIEEIVRSKGKEMDKVPVDDVIGEAISRGIDENKAREIISKLKKSGEIYEPSHGFLKGA
ncbi:MAG: minichromosome maintenance protein MCM [Candidatus Iainarchaeum archaeon]|uniref:DNA helicase n=1 Tax=Candidatus Iainarchaeum sp. TaxID=3101447 RepID=A0A7T9DJM4_9ARCH|nr:MAG: minichromosome maintenance protein MCM [Candidatus Diapherotrites archaeon]